jgi:hypothetical protein
MNPRLPVLLALAALLLVGSLGAASVPQAEADDGFDVSFFYRPLAPHGEWVVLEPYGWAWMPERVDYGWRPYTVGHWAWVEPYGWTWISDEPWGWATYHYGRWLYADDYGWVWVPGTVWAPAWVAFRYGDPWVGWAPLPPGPNWRFDAGLTVGDLNLQVAIGTYAWSFVGLRWFAEPDLRSRVYVSAYNPYLVQRTTWSTRYAPAEGTVANVSVDPAVVERARGAPVPRRRLREASAPDQGGARVEGDAVVVYRPRLVARAPAAEPPAASRRAGGPSAKADAEAWAAQRREALKAHLERQRKALEEQDVAPPPTRRPATPAGRPPSARPPGERPEPGMGTDAADDARSRREAAMKALEEERKRMEELIERRRRRMEQGPSQPPTREGSPSGMGEGPPAMGEDHPGMGGGGGMR